MAITLDAAIEAEDAAFRVAGEVPSEIVAGYRFRIDDELLELSGFGPYPLSGGRRTGHGQDRTHWRVNRGLAGSVAAFHESEAAIRGAVDAWTSGPNEDQPDPFEEVLESLPIATSDVTGLDTALATIPADASELTVSPAVAGESDVQGALEALAVVPHTNPRVLTSDWTIPADCGAVVVGPLDMNGHTITFGSNAALAIV